MVVLVRAVSDVSPVEGGAPYTARQARHPPHIKRVMDAIKRGSIMASSWQNDRTIELAVMMGHITR